LRFTLVVVGAIVIMPLMAADVPADAAHDDGVHAVAPPPPPTPSAAATSRSQRRARQADRQK
jgi:hypothetical protein